MGNINPLTPELFAKNAFFGHFGSFEATAKLALTWSKMQLQHDSLPLSALASCFMRFWLEHAQKSKPYKLVQLVVFKKFTSAYLFQRDHFRYIQIQLGGKAQRTQTQEIE